MPWAIYDDLSGVVEQEDFGIHPTEEAAQSALVLRLESDKTEIAAKITKAKRRLRQLRRNR